MKIYKTKDPNDFDVLRSKNKPFTDQMDGKRVAAKMIAAKHVSLHETLLTAQQRVEQNAIFNKKNNYSREVHGSAHPQLCYVF